MSPNTDPAAPKSHEIAQPLGVWCLRQPWRMPTSRLARARMLAISEIYS